MSNTTYSPVTLVKISASPLNGQLQAELRQTITTMYAKMQTSTSTSDHAFSAEEMKVTMKPYPSVRVYWMKVTEHITEDMMRARLLEMPDARITRTLASDVMLSVEHAGAILAGLTTEAKIAMSQRVKYGKLDANKLPNPLAGTAVLYKGREQYRKYDFKVSGGTDTDLRRSETELPVTPVPVA